MANQKTARNKVAALEAGSGVKISDLPEANPLEGSEFFPVVQDGETRRGTLEQIKEVIPPGAPMQLVNAAEGDVSVPESGYDGTIFIRHGTAHQGVPVVDDGDNRSGSIAIGMGAAADVVATVVGRNARGTGNHGVAVGTEASSGNVKAIAIGYRAKWEGDSSIAVGNESRAAREAPVAIVRKAYAVYASSVAIGTGSTARDSNEVSFGYLSQGSLSGNKEAGWRQQWRQRYQRGGGEADELSIAGDCSA